MRSIVPILMVMSLSCGPQKAVMQENSEYPKHTPPPDLSAKFPKTGQLRMEIVADHLLGKEFFPGGNIATYKTDVGEEYQMFLIKEKTPVKAANLLVDWKATHSDAQYLANFGGYYGLDNGTPVFLFAKGLYVAGFVGLTNDHAEPAARSFAARL